MRRRQSGCCCVEDDTEPEGCGTPWTYTTEFGDQYELRRFTVTLNCGLIVPADIYGSWYSSAPSVMSGTVSTGITDDGSYVGFGGNIDYDALEGSGSIVNGRIAEQGTSVSGNTIPRAYHECMIEDPELGDLDAFAISLRYQIFGSPPVNRDLKGVCTWFNQATGGGFSVSFDGSGTPPSQCKCQYQGDCDPFFACADEMYDYKVVNGSFTGYSYDGCGCTCDTSNICYACDQGLITDEFICKCLELAYPSNGQQSVGNPCSCANDFACTTVPIANYNPSCTTCQGKPIDSPCCPGYSGCSTGHVCIDNEPYGVCEGPCGPSYTKVPWNGSVTVTG